MKSKSVYCSGSLFSPEDISAMNRIAKTLENCGYKTFLPHRDGLEPFVTNYIGTPLANSIFFRLLSRSFNEWLFAYDIYQIVDTCDYFVFNMNGRVPDEGGVVETAVAFATGKPVVLYKADDRSFRDGYDNPMLLGASVTFSTVTDISKIPVALDRQIEKINSIEGDINYRHTIPSKLKETTELGKKVGRYVKAFQFLKPKNKLLE